MFWKFATVFVALVTSQPHQGFTKDLTKDGVNGFSESQGGILKDVVRENFLLNRKRSLDLGEVRIPRSVIESEIKLLESSELQFNDDVSGGINIRDIEDLEKELNLASTTETNSPDSDEGPLKGSSLESSLNEDKKSVDDDLDMRLIRIADHLSKEHLSIENFKPSVSLSKS